MTDEASGSELIYEITVIGCGRWGSFIAWLLDRLHHEVTLYGRENSASMQRWIRERRNDLIELPASVSLSTELSCMTEAEVVVISVGAQDLRALMGEIALLSPKNKIFVLCDEGA